MVYQFSVTEKEAALALQEKLNRALSFYNYATMSTSIDYYTPEVILVIVHGLKTKLGARGFGDVLKDHKEYKIVKPHFEISTPNYKTIQIHKNLSDYLNIGVINP